jgi:hypothetical protein
LKNKALGDKATPGASQAGKPAQELAGAKPKGPAATPAAKGEPASTAPSAPAKDEVKAANGTANKLDQGKGTGPANKAVHRETAEGAKPPGEPPDKSGLGKMPSGLAKHAKLDEVVEQMLEDLPQLKGKLDTELVNKVLKHFDEDIPDVIVEIAKRNRKVEDAVRAVNELLEVAAETGEIENMSDLFHELAGVEAPKRAKMYKPLLGTGASARGADFEIEWVYHRQKTFKDVKRVGIKTVNGLKGADVQMTNGSIVELKNWKLDNFTGRFAEQKAKEIAGQALTRLKAKYSSVHFVFRGTPADMPQAFADALNKELDAVAKQSGLPRSNFGFSLWMP